MNSQKHFCPSCGLQVKPKYKMSGQMGFAVTFIAFFIPFEFFFRFKNRWALGMAMGSLGWLIIPIFVVVYTYLTVEFEPEE
ncbi:MAG: hypothetical protein CSA96_09045 [Bacteroidetes bacterium]|nr:MAG: hypothetical protein CSA96_09045 [Bacteroidota bacterium]